MGVKKKLTRRRPGPQNGPVSTIQRPTQPSLHVRMPAALAERVHGIVDGIVIKSPAHALVVLAAEALDARDEKAL